MPPEYYTKYPKDFFYDINKEQENKVFIILRRNDNSDYTLASSIKKQQIIVICALDAVVKLLTSDPTYKPYRAKYSDWLWWNWKINHY